MDCICTPYPLDFSLTRLRWWWWCPIWLWFNVESWNFRIPDSLLSIFCIQQWLWPRHKMNESMRYHFLFTYGSNPSWKEFWWEWEIDFCPMAKLAWAPMFYLPNQTNQWIHPYFFFYLQQYIFVRQIFDIMGHCDHSWLHVGFPIWIFMAILVTFTICLRLIQI